MMPEFIFAKLDDPMVHGGKVGLLETPGPETGICEATGETVSYESDKFYEVLGVAKDLDAARNAGWFIPFAPDPKPEVVEEKKPQASRPSLARGLKQKDEFCPECGGRRRGRGYAHEDGCSKDSRRIQQENRSDETCPECGGSKRGRGFSHKPGCSKSCKVA